MRINNISDLAVFSEVIKQGNLSAASKKLGLSVAVVSKRLQRLESQLGVSLIHRTTRTLHITDAGQRYFQHCQHILDMVDEAEAEVIHSSQTPTGNLKITAPAYFGRLYIAPLIPRFLQHYPEVNLQTDFTDQFIDIINEGYDLAIRIDNLKDSNLVAKRLGGDQRMVVASPTYLEQFGIPETPDELQQHNVLLFSNPSPQRVWRFVGPSGKHTEVKVSGNFETNNCETLNKVTLAGLGIALRPMWDVWREIESGALIPLLPNYRAPHYDIQALYPSRSYLPHRVRAFLDLLSEHLEKGQPWSHPPATP